MRVTLYRAANTPAMNLDSTSFARSKECAEAYRDNPPFGGSHLYKVTLDVDDREILDLTYDVPSWLAAHMDVGAATTDWLITAAAQERAQQKILARGYRWVKVRDTYPVDCETWVLLTNPSDWYAEDVVEPKMIEI